MTLENGYIQVLCAFCLFVCLFFTYVVFFYFFYFYFIIIFLCLSLSFFFFFLFLGPLPRHVEVPRLGVESEL